MNETDMRNSNTINSASIESYDKPSVEENSTLYANMNRLTGIIDMSIEVENNLTDIIDYFNFRVIPRDSKSANLDISGINDENINVIFDRLIVNIKDKLLNINDKISDIKSYIK
jgi:hypothetical protein